MNKLRVPLNENPILRRALAQIKVALLLKGQLPMMDGGK